jgi:hypothetical protein
MPAPHPLDDSAAAAPRRCGHCAGAMRRLRLAGHYERQGLVEVDLCEPCMLIWFDGVETAHLGGPGLIDLVMAIHDAVGRAGAAPTMPSALACPVCGEPLRKVFNLSRFGRSAQLQCPQRHGAYQSFMLFLAEKGYFRQYTWADIKALGDAGRALSCTQCGEALDHRPHAECPACRCPVGVVDAARLAEALDPHRAASPSVDFPEVWTVQMPCPGCGAPVDPSRDKACRHCQRILPPRETEGAAAVGEALAVKVRENHARQTTAVSRHKLGTLVAQAPASLGYDSSAWSVGESYRRTLIAMHIGVGVAAVLVVGGVFIANRDGSGGGAKDPPPSPTAVVAPSLQPRQPAAPPRLAAPPRPADEAPAAPATSGPVGRTPPQLLTMKEGSRLILFNRFEVPVVVRVQLAVRTEDGWQRCPMQADDGIVAAAVSVRFDQPGESHAFLPSPACDEALRWQGLPSYEVDSAAGAPLFRSDQALPTDTSATPGR